MVHELLMDYRFILASTSPRRLALLTQIGLKPEILGTGYTEKNPVKTDDAEELVLSHARKKLETVLPKISGSRYVVLAADTVVITGERILGKPRDRIEAEQHLRQLSGKTHWVKTGLAVKFSDHTHIIQKSESTQVTFKSLSEVEISSYLDTGESLDKAGSYGIQGLAAQFVTSINGCYFNVVGLPLSAFYELVKGGIDGR